MLKHTSLGFLIIFPLAANADMQSSNDLVRLVNENPPEFHLEQQTIDEVDHCVYTLSTGLLH
ncbi:hypothetical protein KIN_02140 [Litoreibacter roseus]|uniref:Uncharacterized protein n=1 Tax=Litoreibacter roseus TaxID=2601869 RepID=A0A6N6JBA2_9RHOB|nr:hypothetical protein KIN_02140 [Litoreibacter roseus]